ncbi:choice-of-anchor L domain-containing protein [Tropicibacter sp. Alg240-R139]|uniref:choice-of-anchor L domain-containing protein n=1 Tax=Tropicibacter sp. Alg240-R139 TaxID=2305991 RepID=UPI0013E011C7|nr:choice-of-anchor L domain-containing protein [Tropicibacter sp. Alg240-R139]
MPQASQLPVDTQATDMEMAEAMFGNGVKIVSADYSGANSASGIYSNGDSVSDALTPSDTGVILSTGRANEVTNSNGDVNDSSGTTTNHGRAGDDDLTEMAGAQTYDAAVFEAEFIPDGNTLTMQFTFASEEYLEYVGSGFNDAVGIYVNGEPAELMVGDGEVTINNINDTSNSNLYIDNAASSDDYNTEMDGFTVTLTVKAPVNAGEVNTIKIAVADGGDGAYDSNLLIAGDSIQSTLIATNDEVDINADGEATVDVLANDNSQAAGEMKITMINGQAVSAGDTITLNSGEEITVNGDGTLTVEADEDEGSNSFSYQVEDGAGNTDTAIVTIRTTPCFVAGTLIDTVDGCVPVENLKPGDLVHTRDHGPQPLRWIGQTERIAKGNDAPILFARSALGNHDAVAVSPNHRILLTTALSEMMFGSSEVLVQAKHLINDRSIRRCADGQPITYVHLLFDRHEVVRGNGLESESYHPGDMTMHAFDANTRDEILDLMPDLTKRDYGYGPSARMSLRGYETRALIRG